MTPSAVTRKSGQISMFRKYNQSLYFILHEFCTDIVFELDNGTKISKTVYHVNLPIYAGQPIELISIDDTIIAFEDKKNNEYHYLSNHPGRDFNKLHISWMHIIVLTMLLYGIITFAIPNAADYAAFALLLPICFRVFRAIQDEYLEMKLDKLIAT